MSKRKARPRKGRQAHGAGHAPPKPQTQCAEPWGQYTVRGPASELVRFRAVARLRGEEPAALVRSFMRGYGMYAGVDDVPAPWVRASKRTHSKRNPSPEADPVIGPLLAQYRAEHGRPPPRPPSPMMDDLRVTSRDDVLGLAAWFAGALAELEASSKPWAEMSPAEREQALEAAKVHLREALEESVGPDPAEGVTDDD